MFYLIDLFFICCLVLAAIFAIVGFFILKKAQLFANIKSKQDSFANLLDYAVLIDDRSFLLKTGAIMQCFELIPKDLSQYDELNLQHFHEILHKSLQKLDGSFCFSVDIRRNLDYSYSPKFMGSNEVARFLDEKRKELFSQNHNFKNRFYLNITFLGHALLREKFESLMQEDLKDSQNEDFKAFYLKFLHLINEIVSTISLVIEIKPLSFNEDRFNHHLGVDYINACIHGIDRQVYLPRGKYFLDAILSNQNFYAGLHPKIGNKYIKVVTFDYFPETTTLLMLNTINNLPCEFRFNHRYYSFDKLKTALLLEKMRRFWQQKTKGIIAQIFNLEGRINNNAKEYVDQIDDGKHRFDNQELSFGSYCGNIVLYDEDLKILEFSVSILIKELENLGFSPRLETLNTTEAYLGSLPGHFHENIRRPMISSEVFIDLVAINKVYNGEQFCPNPLIGKECGPLMQATLASKENFYLNLFSHDLGNSLIVGPPGAGKSVLLGAIVNSFYRYKNAKVFVFDKGFSFYALCKALGGQHILCDGNQALLCPLAELSSKQHFSYAYEFIIFLSKCLALNLNDNSLNELTTCLTLLQKEKVRSLSALYLLVQDPNLKRVLSFYISNENQLSILDGKTNLRLHNSLSVFELQNLLQKDPSYYLPILKQFFHLINKSLDGSPCLIVIDEAWVVFQDEFFSNELFKWFKTLRKYNASVVIATQSLCDLKESGFFEPLLDCVKTRIFLPNLDASGVALKSSYIQMGLTSKQIDAIADGIVKQDYFFLKDQAFAKFKLMLSKAELKLLSFSADFNVAMIDSLYEQFGPWFFNEQEYEK